MIELKYIDADIILWLLMVALLYLMWKITKMQYEYHEYSFQCLECNRHYVTRSRIKMFFIEIYHSFICEWKR